jgi:hypothetical protein
MRNHEQRDRPARSALFALGVRRRRLLRLLSLEAMCAYRRDRNWWRCSAAKGRICPIWPDADPCERIQASHIGTMHLDAKCIIGCRLSQMALNHAIVGEIEFGVVMRRLA